MRARTLILLMFALIAAGGTYVLAQNWINTQRGALNQVAKQAKPKLTPTIEVLVAATELTAGQFIKAPNLRWQTWPKEGVSEAYFVKGKKYPATNEKGEKIETDIVEAFVGSVVRSRISAGEPISDGRVVRPGERGFLAAVLGAGNRAISVPINATTGIAGFVFPGDRVDLLLTHSITESVDSDTVRRATETVLSDIRVLAVDQRTDDSEGKAALAKTATLEVTPKQAEIISVANELGRLSLSLRSLAQSEATDDLRPAGQAHTWDTEASRLIPRKSSSNVVAVKVVRGGATSSVNFERSGGQGYVVTGGITQGYVATGGASALQNTATQTVTKSAGAPVNLIQKVN